MMKYHGLYQPASGARETFKPINAKEEKSPDSTPVVAKAAKNTKKSPTSSPSKKPRQSYKGFEGGNSDLAVDDDEGLIPTGSEAVKAEKLAPNAVKGEFEAYGGIAGFRYPLMDGDNGREMEDCADVLGEFLQPGDFEQQDGSGRDGSDIFGHGYSGIEYGRPSSEGTMTGNPLRID
jgi:hypothetical protein